MIKYLLGIIVTAFASMGYAQSESKSDAVDVLLEENQAKASTERIMLGLIRSYINQKPDAPKSLEREIQNSLDYKGYMERVKAAYDKTYTEAEIRELTLLHQSGDMELYKQRSDKVAKALYDIGNEFGRESAKIIQAKLQAY